MLATPVPEPAITPITVLLLDDHRVFTDALRVSLEMQPDVTCVGVAHSGHEAMGLASAVAFEVAIVDLDLPDTGGLELIDMLLSRRPEARVVVVTAHSRLDLAERAFAAGASAFLGKDATLQQILSAIRASDNDPKVLDPALHHSPPPAVSLTHREHDVLRQLACGQDTKQIAGRLGISVHTTRDHIKAVMAKLDVHSQLGAVVAAERLGLVTVGSRY